MILFFFIEVQGCEFLLQWLLVILGWSHAEELFERVLHLLLYFLFEPSHQRCVRLHGMRIAEWQQWYVDILSDDRDYFSVVQLYHYFEGVPQLLRILFHRRYFEGFVDAGSDSPLNLQVILFREAQVKLIEVYIVLILDILTLIKLMEAGQVKNGLVPHLDFLIAYHHLIEFKNGLLVLHVKP